MARAVALSVLRSDVRAKADINSATVRHTDAQIDRFINQSIQMFRERISDEGSTHYLESSSGALGIGPTSPFAFYKLDLSGVTDLVRVYGIDVTFDGGQVVTLDRVPFEARNDYGTAQSGSIPRAWAPFKTAQIAILPASSSALPYTVWYLPKFTDLVADGDTFDGVAGWEEWVVWDVVAQIAIRDQNPQALQVAEARRVEVEQRVIRGATKVTQAGGAHVGRDSFGGKLTHFLGGRRQTPAVAGGPYVPADGSVTNQMLADMTGPTVKGVMSGTTRPKDVQVATLTTYLGLFNTMQRGTVPPPLSTTGLFLRDDGTWASAAGAGSAQGASGTVQYQAGGGAFRGASGFSIIGDSPSLIARVDGTVRVTGGQVEVGSGTVLVSASGIDVGGGSVIGVGTLVASAIAAPAFTDTAAGLAPASGGGTSNFLRADGTWAAAGGGSPGGASGAIQYNDGGSFAGQTGVSMHVHGGTTAPAIGFGNINELQTKADFGNIRVASGFSIIGLTPSSIAGPAAGANLVNASVLTWTPGADTVSTGGVLQFGTSGSRSNETMRRIFSEIATGGDAVWRFGLSNATVARINASGFSVATGHIHARSISVYSGIPNDQLSPMASGTIKGQLGADAIPQDIPLHSLTAALYHFDTVTRGVAPVSPGGTSAFLRADGAWASPPGGSASPSGPAFSVQFQNNGTFGGSTGISVGGSGTSFRFGASPAATGFLGLPHSTNGGIYGRAVGGTQDLPVLRWGVSDFGNDSAMLGGSGVARVVYRGGRAGQGGHQFEIDGYGGNALLVELQSNLIPKATVEGDLTAFGALTVGTGITNANLHPMGSGTVKANLGPTGTPSDVPLATLLAFAPTFTAARMGVVPASGGGVLNFLRADGSWTVPSGVPQFPPSGGVQNYQMAPVASGTVKGNLGPSGPVADINIPTLLGLTPTFTSLSQGTVPPSGGGTANYLRADGTWNTPPGGAASPGGGLGAIQYHNGVGFGGGTGINVVGSGVALGFGVPSFLPSSGDIRVASGFNITANLPSGIAGVAARQVLFDWSGGGASGVLRVGGASGILGTNRNEVATGGAHEWLIGGQTGASLRATGLDVSQFHVRARSLDVLSINGLPADANQLKRGLDIGSSSGMPSGLSLYLPRGAASGANRYIIPSGAVGTGTPFVTLSPTAGRGGNTIRIERPNSGAFPFEVRTPTGTVLYSFPSGTKHVADFVFTKPSGTAFELGGAGDLY